MTPEGNPDITWVRQRPGLNLSLGCIVGLGILSALIVAGYYGVSGVRVHGKEVQTKAVCQSVVNAVGQFGYDLDCLPVPPGVRSGRDFDTDTTGATGIITVLKGCDMTQNPKQTDYLGEIKEARTLAGPRYVDGLYREKEDVVALYDAWGLPYHMRLDGDGDNTVEDPSHPGTQLFKRTLVWSAGRDGDFSTWGDNVTSW